jgi:NAD-dependent DNA ligase
VFLVVVIILILSRKNKNKRSEQFFPPQQIKQPDPKHVYYKIHEKEIEANRISTDYNIKNLDIEDKTSIFYDKNIVITGTFNLYSREDIAAYIHSKGGARRSSITSATDIVIIGSINPGPTKLLQIEELIKSGSKLQVIQEDEFIEIIKK